MTRENRSAVALRIGIAVAVTALLIVWLVGRGREESSSSVTSGLQLLQRQRLGVPPTIVTAPRRPFLPIRGPTSTPPAAPPGSLDHPVLTEALEATGASEYHRNGTTGRGVRVAVVDTQFDGLERAIAAGEIPADGIALRLTADGVFTQELTADTGPHGTACAEIVHDLAPDAELVLVQVENFLQTAEALFEYLAEEKVRIVSLSISVVTAGRADGTGMLGDPPVPIYDILRNAAESHGMLIVVSAGNYGRQHYTGYFQDHDGDDLHEFGCVSVNHCDESISVSAREGAAFALRLSWEEHDPVSLTLTTTYGLIVTDPRGRQLEAATSASTGQIPPMTTLRVESPADGDYTVQIRREPGVSTAHSLRLWITGAVMPLSRHQVPQGSLGSPADSASVIAVGAANVDTGLLVATSSQGPTADGRIKPDLISYAHVSVSDPAYGHRGFIGTSAAAPHVAGIAALLADRISGGTAAGPLREMLLTAASDGGAAGPDPLWGMGLARLPPLSTIVELVDDVGEGSLAIDHLGRATVQTRVLRGDHSHIRGLGAAAFQVVLDDLPATVIAALDLEDRYLMRVRWPPEQLTLDEGRRIALRLTVQPGSLGAAGSDTASVVPKTDVSRDLARSRLTVVPAAAIIPVGAPVRLATVLEETSPLLGARIVVSAAAPVDRHEALQLLDDGQSGDGLAGDGVYGGLYPATQLPGTYSFSLTALNSDGTYIDSREVTVEAVGGLDDWDGDGLPAGWEDAVGLSRVRDDRFRDPDADGLTNEEEYLIGSDPHDWDTDGDGLNDFLEATGYFATSPYNQDTDLGGASDAEELANRTDPRDPADDHRVRDTMYLPLVPKGG